MCKQGWGVIREQDGGEDFRLGLQILFRVQYLGGNGNGRLVYCGRDRGGQLLGGGWVSICKGLVGFKGVKRWEQLSYL